MNWLCLTFEQLTTNQLYELMKLRVDVFVVEQNCPYPELDEKDRAKTVHHLMAYDAGKLVAYARLLTPGLSYDSVSIGRVCVAESHRRVGLGRELAAQALNHCQRIWPNQNIEIGAQEYLLDFYLEFGFEPCSEVYLEDGLPHLDMRLTKSSGELEL